MDLNATLFGQLITFAIFVWFTMRYVWPPITKALSDRQNTIAEGLAAAERGKHEMELAVHKSSEILRDAKIQAAKIVEEAGKRSTLMIEEAKDKARQEGERLLAISHEEVEKLTEKARESLKDHVASIAMSGAEKILGRNIDRAANSELLEKLITEI